MNQSAEPPGGALRLDPSHNALRDALWSVYYHALNLPSLTKSALELVRVPSGDDKTPPPLRLTPLNDAVGLIAKAFDPHARLRRLRALRKMARAGFANTARRRRLLGQYADDADKIRMVEAVWAAVRDLVGRVSAEWEMNLKVLSDIEPAYTESYIDEKLMMSAGCAPVGMSCQACFELHNSDAGGEPVTTVTARSYVKRDLADLATAIDPRAWNGCSDTFTTSDRVASVGGPIIPPLPGELGQSWSGFLDEIVVINDSSFENFLNIVFEVDATQARVDYSLAESGSMTIPSLFIEDRKGSVTIDRGFLLATASTNSHFPHSDNWKFVKIVKTVRFVDLTDSIGTNPWGVDPGEILNYWAPTILSLWLEDSTQGGPCCTPSEDGGT